MFRKGRPCQSKERALGQGRRDCRTQQAAQGASGRKGTVAGTVQVGNREAAGRLPERDRRSHPQGEAAEQHSKEKDAVIDKQRKQIDQLDRKANPQRYSLSSGAELVRINVSNYRNPSLHIWTRVGEELFEDTKFQINYDVAQKHFSGQTTDEEFVNAIFEPQEQVSGKQAELLGAAFTIAIGGPAEVNVGTSDGGSSSDLPWSEKKHDNNITSFKLKQ